MRAKPEMKYSTKQVFNKNKIYKKKLIFKQFFIKETSRKMIVLLHAIFRGIDSE